MLKPLVYLVVVMALLLFVTLFHVECNLNPTMSVSPVGYNANLRVDCGLELK
jgi:hypothetical protein